MWSQLTSCAHLLVRDEQGDSLIVVRLFPEKGEGTLQKRTGCLLSGEHLTNVTEHRQACCPAPALWREAIKRGLPVKDKEL